VGCKVLSWGNGFLHCSRSTRLTGSLTIDAGRQRAPLSPAAVTCYIFIRFFHTESVAADTYRASIRMTMKPDRSSYA
jgi:hypothetical protein